jgi:hypothetical protein
MMIPSIYPGSLQKIESDDPISDDPLGWLGVAWYDALLGSNC